MGIHVAARIGAQAEGGEILASSATVAAAGDVPVLSSREAPIRGSAAPVQVASIRWS
jgi:class 3 adenylate cyclase